MALPLMIVVALLSMVMARAFFLLVRQQPAVSDTPLQRVDDRTTAETLDFWGNVYQANNFRRWISFEQFMTNPRGYLNVMCFPPVSWDLDSFRPLLPAQQLVYERVLLAELQAEEAVVQEERQLVALQAAYQEISTNDQRLYSPMHRPRCPRKWKSRGLHLIPRHA